MVGRYLQAFVTTLRLTLRGETLPPDPNQPLRDWMARALTLADQVESLAAQHGVQLADVILHIDMRDTSMALILRIVRYHMNEEYPLLLREGSPQHLLMVQATNLDDLHRVSHLENAPELVDTPVQQAVAALTAHLEALPENK